MTPFRAGEGDGGESGERGGIPYPFAIRVVEGLELYDVWVSHNSHDLQLTILQRVSQESQARGVEPGGGELTLNLLSWSTRLIAASSFEGESLVWKTTPKEPLPTILHWVYWISLVSPVTPSWTFSRITSIPMSAASPKWPF